MYCVKCETAIAQAELEDKQKSTKFVYMIAEVEGGKEIVFATTRPELLPDPENSEQGRRQGR